MLKLFRHYELAQAGRSISSDMVGPDMCVDMMNNKSIEIVERRYFEDFGREVGQQDM